MSRIIGFGSLVFATSLLMAAALDPVLVDSPWVKQAPVALLLVRGEAQLREGGRLGGGGKRAGLGKVKTLPGTLEVRWESATPIRARNSRPAESRFGIRSSPEAVTQQLAVDGCVYTTALRRFNSSNIGVKSGSPSHLSP